MAIVPNQQQMDAYNAIVDFILDPDKDFFILRGYAGTGKTTLMEYFLENLSKIVRLHNLAFGDKQFPQVFLTATTNKAAEQLAYVADTNVQTLDSFLQLRLSKDLKTGETRMVARKIVDTVYDAIVIVDEASYMNSTHFHYIKQHTKNCKFLLIGDPKQLLNVRSTHAEAFSRGYDEVALTEIVRQQANNPIIALATQFREALDTNEFFSFEPDGTHIVHMDRDSWEKAVIDEMTDVNWKPKDSRILAWTNKTVVAYNKAIAQHASGSPHFNAGDYAVCNSYFVTPNGKAISTDATVYIDKIKPDTSFGYPGSHLQISHGNLFIQAFLPEDQTLLRTLPNRLRKAGEYNKANTIETSWIDLRHQFASTVNKAQGSTFDSVYIDLDDIGKCRHFGTLMRILYVAVSRARHHVYLVGDL